VNANEPTNLERETMKVKLNDILNSQQEIQQIAAVALPPKAKYWVMRMVAKANAAGEAFAQKRNELIMKMGEQVFLFVPSAEESGSGKVPAWVPIEDGQDLTGLQTQWRVKAENVDEYTKLVIEMGEEADDVEMPCDAIHLDVLGDAPIAVDLSKLGWMFAA
jgi:hypothetical protein